MAASSIFFNGQLIRSSGSYSKVDASALEQVGLGASGIVAVLGTAIGGKPVSAIDNPQDLEYVTKPEKMRDLFRSGDLREAGDMLFAPSSDPDIPGGAQAIIPCKVNPATQATGSLANAQGNAIDLTSEDYGAFTNQINVTVATGTNQGKRITVTFEDVVEAGDDIGGEDMFTLLYNGGANEYDTALAEVLSTGALKVTATRSSAGLDGDVGTQAPPGTVVEVVSSNVADTTQVVTLIGTNELETAAQFEELTLNGTTAVTSALSWGKVLGVKISAVTAGNITVDPSGGGTDIFLITAGTTDAGVAFVSGGFVENTVINLTADAASTAEVVVFGLSPSGAQIAELITLNGTTPVPTTQSFSKLDLMALGDVASARTATATVVAIQSDPAVQSDLTKLSDHVNAKWDGSVGFTLTLVTTLLTFDVTDLDVSVSSASCLTALGFRADLYHEINWFNQNSDYVTAVAASGATGGEINNTTAPVFLSGAIEGTVTQTEWDKAFTLLKQRRVNTVVPLTGDASIHQDARDHCALMGGVGRSERDAVVGVKGGSAVLPTKTEFKDAIKALNTRHVRAIGQTVTRFNTEGVKTVFAPHFAACLAAGMQAGSEVGTSLTHKQVNVLDFDQDSSWNPMDDAEELLAAGAMFMENIENIGLRWKRNITTHLSTNNIAFTEASVNEAANYATYEFRTTMEAVVGKKGFAGTVNGAKGMAVTKLGLLVSEGALTDWRSLALELAVDVLEVEVEIAPVIPINFVKNVLHLVTTPQTA